MKRGPAAERPSSDYDDVPLLGHRDPALQPGKRGVRRARRGGGREETSPRNASHGGVGRGLRASRTARATASRSPGGSDGPHGSSHASPGITPSAASAHNIRRTKPSTGGANAAAAKRSQTPESRTNRGKSPERNDSI